MVGEGHIRLVFTSIGGVVFKIAADEHLIQTLEVFGVDVFVAVLNEDGVVVLVVVDIKGVLLVCSNDINAADKVDVRNEEHRGNDILILRVYPLQRAYKTTVDNVLSVVHNVAILAILLADGNGEVTRGGLDGSDGIGIVKAVLLESFLVGRKLNDTVARNNEEGGQIITSVYDVKRSTCGRDYLIAEDVGIFIAVADVGVGNDDDFLVANRARKNELVNGKAFVGVIAWSNDGVNVG